MFFKYEIGGNKLRKNSKVILMFIIISLCCWQMNDVIKTKAQSLNDSAIYDQIYSFDEGQGRCARAIKDEAWYLIDRKYEEIFGPVDYIYPLDTISGTAAVKKGKEVSVIVWNEETVTQRFSFVIPDNCEVIAYQENMVKIFNKKTAKMGIVTMQGVFDQEYDEIAQFNICYIFKDKNRQIEDAYLEAEITDENKKGILICDGNNITEVIPAKYREIIHFENGLYFLIGFNEKEENVLRLADIHESGEIEMINLFDKATER